MADGGVKGRVRGMFTVPPGDDLELPESRTPDDLGHAEQFGVSAALPSQAAASQQEALQVLTLAQRTAEEHLLKAQHEADRIRAEAREAAGQIVNDARAHAEAQHRDAEAALSEAHAAAARIVEEAQARADQAGQDAEEILSDARVKADGLAKVAQAKADELQQLAEQRYEEVVGGMAAKRETLQQQIETLERFDREYRLRLQTFMQHQLRALWVDQPQVSADDPGPASAGSHAASEVDWATAPVPAPRDGADQLADTEER